MKTRTGSVAAWKVAPRVGVLDGCTRAPYWMTAGSEVADATAGEAARLAGASETELSKVAGAEFAARLARRRLERSTSAALEAPSRLRMISNVRR
eukprot:6589609-Pyramimonas_sp.AAC.1